MSWLPPSWYDEQNEFGIYLDDLTDDAQQRLLEFLEIVDLSEMNLEYNYIPVAMVPKPIKDD